MIQSQSPPAVSVILPLYNMERHATEAIESLLQQSFPHWDAWIVDDGSKDGSPSIAKRFAADHPGRIHSLEHDGHRNRGVSASRNLAIARSKSEFVAFLDADDVWEPTKLERQLRVFQSHPEVGMVYSTALAIREDGTPWMPSEGAAAVKLVWRDDKEFRAGRGTPNQPVDLFEELVHHCCVVNSTVIVRRNVLGKAGQFDETMRYAEDWLLYTCVAYHTKTYFLQESLARYRIHDSHFSASLVGDQRAQLDGSATFLRKLSERLGRSDPRVRKIVAEARRQLHGRMLSLSEKQAREGERGNSMRTLVSASRTFPSLVVSRRTLRTVGRLLGIGTG